MYSRLFKPPEKKSFFVFGPRGVGKTTWVKTAFPAALYIDLLEAELFNDLLANPQRLESMIIPKTTWVIIDEIQRIPELLNEVHRLIEKRRIKFVLTGSSARKLRKLGHNLLAGRALSRSFHPLTATELGDDFDLAHSLRFGQLPCAYTETDPKAYLESYVKTYLEQEIRQEGLTRNLGAFARFLEAASFSQGSPLNISAVAQECSVERKVVENYFNILEDLLVAVRLPVFTKKAKRRLSLHPKFYFFDAGVFRTLRPNGPLDTPQEADGPALETLLLEELLAINASLDLGYRMFYWRTANNVEVDFVLYGERGFYAFEVKRSARFNAASLKGLLAFKTDYPTANVYLLYGGSRRLFVKGVHIVPYSLFVKELPQILVGKIK
jgi:predicted AAA+ superfamily ATPase